MDGSECFDTEIPCVPPRPVSGYFARPAGAAPQSLPAILLVHGAGVRSSSLGGAAGSAKRYNALAMDINAHGIANGRPESFYQDLAAGELKDYRTAGREDREQDQVWVKLAQRRFQPDARVTFTAGVNSPSGEPIAAADLRCELTLPDGSRREVSATRDGTQWLGSIETVTAPGDYAVEVTAARDGKVVGKGRGEFLVFDRDVELSTPAADHDQLARLAAMTKPFGGRVVAPEQVPSLLEDIRDRPPEMDIEVQTKWQLADTGRDAWSLLLLLVALLTAEWFLRKKWGLV